MPNRTLVRAAVALGLLLALFTVTASLIFLYAAGLASAFSVPIYQWWTYLACCGSNPVVRPWLYVSGIPAAAVTLLLGSVLIYNRQRFRGWSLRRDFPPGQVPSHPVRSSTDNHGHARWATLAEAANLWPGVDPAYGGIVVAEAYDPRGDDKYGPFDPRDKSTWGRGGTKPLMIDPCHAGSTHSIVVAGSGSFKTVSAVSTLLTWTGSTVVLDPAAELGPMLEDARRRMGHRVHILSPDHAATCGFNALDWIDITSPLAETDCAAVVEWLCGYTPRRDQTAQFFKDKGKALVLCLLAHLLWDPDLAPDLKTLRTLRKALTVSEGEMRRFLKEKIYKTSKSQLARDLAGPLCELVAETFSGIYANADEDTRWLSVPAYADLVSGDTFRTADIIKGDCDVFVSLPLKALQATPSVGRCIIGALLNAAYEADGNVRGRILFMLDEAARLGHMDILESARDAGRKYGITLHLIYQSVGQIERQWGKEGKRTWYETVSWLAFAAIKDLETAREVSESIGEHGVLSWSESRRQFQFFGRGQSGSNITYSERSRRVVRPEELMNDLRADAQIILPKNGRPVLAGRPIYFRRRDFAARVSANRFAESTVTGRDVPRLWRRTTDLYKSPS